MDRLYQRHGIGGVISCTVFLMAGCASMPPPTEQLAVSKAAVTSAVSAGGNEFASIEMKAAQEKLDRATQALEKEDYENARWLAEQAQIDATLAEKKAQSAKAQKAANVIQNDIRILSEEINRKSP